MNEKTRMGVLNFTMAAWLVASAALYGLWPFIIMVAVVLALTFLRYFLLKRRSDRTDPASRKPETRKILMYNLMWGIAGVFISCVLYGMSYLA